MGWASGSILLAEIVDKIDKAVVDFDTKVDVFKILIAEFENRDCDTTGEVVGSCEAFDYAYKQLYGDEEDEDDYYDDADT